MTKKVWLDWGHGGRDPGAINASLKMKEAEEVLKIGEVTANYLKKNYKVELGISRTDNSTVDLTERSNRANNMGAHFFISLHLNSSINKTASGMETFIYTKTNRIPDEYQKILHEELYDTLKKYGIQDRGKKRNNFSVLRKSLMPACLIEVLFISNNEEAKLLQNDDFIKDTGEAIARGIAKALNLPKLSTLNIPTVESPHDPFYRIRLDGVQIGATKMSLQSYQLSDRE